MINKNLLLGCLAMAASFAVQAADFALVDVDGQAHKLSDYRGKWVG